MKYTYTGYRIEQMWDKISGVVGKYPIVVLHIGANNFWNDSVTKIMKLYQALASQIWSVNSSCRIVISGLLPRGQNRFPGSMKSLKFLTMVNRKALTINQKLSYVAKSHPRLTYIGHSYFVVNGVLQGLLSRDGLHLNREGTARVVNELESAVNRMRMSVFDAPALSLSSRSPRHLPPTNAIEEDMPVMEPVPTPYRDALMTPIPVDVEEPVSVEESNTLPTPYRDALLVPVPVVQDPEPETYVSVSDSPDDWPLIINDSFPFQVKQDSRTPAEHTVSVTTSVTSEVVFSCDLPKNGTTTSTTLESAKLPDGKDALPEKVEKTTQKNQSTTSKFMVQVDGNAEVPEEVKQDPMQEYQSSSSDFNKDIYFKGDKHILSNFYLCNITYNNRVFRSVEHAYQYQSAIYHRKYSKADQILSAPKASDAKDIAKTIHKHSTWHSYKRKLMGELVQIKFDQVPAFQQFLLRTGSRRLLHNVYNRFWGTGRYEDGKNFFGKLLMLLRDNNLNTNSTQTNSYSLQKPGSFNFGSRSLGDSNQQGSNISKSVECALQSVPYNFQVGDISLSSLEKDSSCQSFADDCQVYYRTVVDECQKDTEAQSQNKEMHQQTIEAQSQNNETYEENSETGNQNNATDEKRSEVQGPMNVKLEQKNNTRSQNNAKVEPKNKTRSQNNAKVKPKKKLVPNVSAKYKQKHLVDTELDKICKFIENSNSNCPKNMSNGNNENTYIAYKSHKESSQIVIDVHGKKIVYNSKTVRVKLDDIKNFLHETEKIPKVNQYLYTLNGKKLADNFSSSEIQNIVLRVKGKGGGKRGPKGSGSSHVHPDRECGPCHLCKSTSSTNYIHLMQRDQNYIDLVKRKFSESKNDSCICKKCHLELQRELEKPIDDDENLTSGKKQKSSCFLTNFDLCTEEGSHRVPCTKENLAKCFELTDLDKLAELFHSDFKICPNHKTALRNFLELTSLCSFCEQPLHSIGRKRFFSSDLLPYAVQYVSLYTKKEIPKNLSSDDFVCNPCYRKLIRFRSRQNENDTSIIEKSKEKCSEILHQFQNDILNAAGDQSFANIIIFICAEFINDRPVLLQDLLDMYNSQNKDIQFSFTARSLLDRLLEVFGDVITASSSKQYPRLGTMLKMVGSDDTLSFLHLLSELRTYKTSHDFNATKVSEDMSCLSKSANILHDKLVLLANEFKMKQSNKELLKQFNAKECIDSISPVLWNFISVLLSGDKKSYKTSIPNLADVNEDRDISFRKLFTLCLLVFQIDDTCQYPLHMILADVIDKYTNSSKECFQILNKFGICISKDTHLRHQNVIIEKSIATGPPMDHGTFTVASADNINKRSSYATVKSSDTKRGFDGTSVQLVQPNSKLGTKQIVNENLLSMVSTGETFKINGSKVSAIQLPGEPMECFFRSLVISFFESFQTCSRNEKGEVTDEFLNQQQTLLTEELRDIFKNIMLHSYELIESIHLNDKFVLPSDCLNFEHYLLSDKRLPSEIDFQSLAFLTGSKVNIYEKNMENNLTHTTSYQRPDAQWKHEFHFLHCNEDAEKYELLLQFSDNFILQNEFCNNLEDKLLKLRTENNVQLNFSDTDFKIMLEKPKLQTNSKSRSRKRTVDQSVLDKKLKVTGFPSTNACKISNVWSDCLFDIFEFTDSERKQVDKFKQEAFSYCCRKYIVEQDSLDLVLPSFQTFLEKQHEPHTEQSAVHYLCVLDENADSKDTIKLVLDILFSVLMIGKQIQHLVVVGDGKTYDHLIKLKDEYGNALSWLLPFPGDWHALKNYQSVLMKIYLQAGLQELIELYHFGATAAAVSTASNFEKTHNFLLQCWEAMYRYELSKFFEYISGKEDVQFCFHEFKNKVAESLQNDSFSFSENITRMLDILGDVQEDFDSFCLDMCSMNETWKFWHDFIHNHCFVYVCYFLAIRSANWDLRCYCVKHICRLLQITDSKYYARLLPQSVAHTHTFPPSVLENFQKGGFVINVLGRNWHFQGLDEGHESCINRDVKQVLNAVTKNYLSKIIHYLPFRASVLGNIKNQLGMVSESQYKHSQNELIEIEKNVRTLIVHLTKSQLFVKEVNDSVDLFEDHVEKLKHIFKNTDATDAVRDDALNLYEKGNEHLQTYIQSCFKTGNFGFKINRTKKLFTFENKKPSFSKLKRGYKDQQLENKMLRKMLAWSKENNIVVQDIQQFISLPRAIADTDGLPYKSAKSKIIDLYKTRYSEAFKDTTQLSQFNCVVIDGMFILNTSPLKSHVTFSDYFKFLYDRWIMSYYEFGITEVHLVFDNQLLDDQSPKIFERSRRDKKGDAPTDTLVELGSVLPRNWRKFLLSRKNKKNLINVLSDYFLELSETLLLEDQIFVTGGGFADCNISKRTRSGATDMYPECRSNIQEGDSLVWLHAFKAEGDNVCIYSPDNDTYHIGLPLVLKYPNKNVCVMLKSDDPIFLNMNTLVSLVQNDSDLNFCDLDSLVKLFQVVYVSTGCDYISFFKDHSKRAFTETVIKNIKFICSDSLKWPGLLSNISRENLKSGFLSFVRMVGCEYFKKCSSAFIDISSKNFVSGDMLFNHLYDETKSAEENHQVWLSKIRESLFSRVQSEEYFLPSYDALWYHWLRSCWVCQVWQQADTNDVCYPPYTEYGWSFINNKLNIIWDSPENVNKVNANIKLWTTGCGCLKTMCKGNRCKCKRENRTCGPGCKCGSLCLNRVIEPTPDEQHEPSQLSQDQELVDFLSSQYSDSEISTYETDSSESDTDDDLNSEGEQNMSSDNESNYNEEI